MKRREAREKALQALFQIELNEMSLDQAIKNIMEDEQDDYMEKLVEGVMANKAEIDAIIEPNLDNWRMDRLSKVDLSLLRLSVYEIKYLDDVPNRVSLNESIRKLQKFTVMKNQVNLLMAYLLILHRKINKLD